MVVPHLCKSWFNRHTHTSRSAPLSAAAGGGPDGPLAAQRFPIHVPYDATPCEWRCLQSILAGFACFTSKWNYCRVTGQVTLCMSQRCQWHRCAMCSRNRFPYKKTACRIIREDIWKKFLHSGVNDTSVLCTAVSLTCDMHRGVIDTSVTCTAVSLTPLWYAERCHLHRCDRHSDVIYTAVQPNLPIFFANSKPYSKRL
jgi:hypothetical protein